MLFLEPFKQASIPSIWAMAGPPGRQEAGALTTSPMDKAEEFRFNQRDEDKGDYENLKPLRKCLTADFQMALPLLGRWGERRTYHFKLLHQFRGMYL